MTNQLAYADLDTTTIAPAPSPIRTIPPSTGGQPERPARSGRRWMIVGGGIALAAAAAIGIGAAGDDATDTVGATVEQRSASAIIQDEIDAALAARTAASELTVRPPAYLVVQSEIDAALAERNASAAEARPTAQIIQDEIDAALAELDATAADSPQRPAHLVVQSEIDAALAARAGTSGD